jgi:NAD(P)H-flavin reductase/cytochrome b involved in lipid metabolism
MDTLNDTRVLLSTDEVATHNTPESSWIIFDGNVYDITHFISTHPGGENILLGYVGCDITEPFAEIGHTSHARDLLKDMFIGKLGDTIHFNRAQITTNTQSLLKKIKQRLFTQEDQWNIHKLCGFVCLIGFTAAFIRIFQPNHVFFAKPSVANLFLLACHCGVALSALMFHVPLKRYFNTVSTLEYKELRLHSMCFSFRSVTLILWYMFEPVFIILIPWIAAYVWVIRALLLSIWHALADLATRKFAGLNGTTIRGLSDIETEIDRLGTSLASLAQLGAILILLGFSATNPTHRAHLGDLCYLTLIPIQLVTFQLTLKRKGFLSSQASGWIYMIELGLVAFALAPGSREMLLLVLYGITRFIFRWNKYVLFLCFAFLAQHFTYTVNPWLPAILGVSLLIAMRWKYRIQGFRVPTTIRCQLLHKEQVNENSYFLTMKMPRGFSYTMPAGKHVALQVDEKSQRFYTPISYSRDGRTFQILAKTYPNGKANKLFASVQKGDKLVFNGPFGNTFYAENKTLRHGDDLLKLNKKRILCIAGGSGITPIYAILSRIKKNVAAELVYINRRKKDILLLDKIENFKKNIKVTHYLTQETTTEASHFQIGRYHPIDILADIILISGPAEFCQSYQEKLRAIRPESEIIVFH